MVPLPFPLSKVAEGCPVMAAAFGRNYRLLILRMAQQPSYGIGTGGLDRYAPLSGIFKHGLCQCRSNPAPLQPRRHDGMHDIQTSGFEGQVLDESRSTLYLRLETTVLWLMHYNIFFHAISN